MREIHLETPSQRHLQSHPTSILLPGTGVQPLPTARFTELQEQGTKPPRLFLLAKNKPLPLTPAKSHALTYAASAAARHGKREGLPCWAFPCFLHLPRPPFASQKDAGYLPLPQGFR